MDVQLLWITSENPLCLNKKLFKRKGFGPQLVEKYLSSIRQWLDTSLRSAHKDILPHLSNHSSETNIRYSLLIANLLGWIHINLLPNNGIKLRSPKKAENCTIFALSASLPPQRQINPLTTRFNQVKVPYNAPQTILKACFRHQEILPVALHIWVTPQKLA